MPFKIREFRKKRNMTQTELCKIASVSRQTLINLESGKGINPKFATLKKIANALRCKVSSIFLS